MSFFKKHRNKSETKKRKSGEERRTQSNNRIKAMGIACFEQLPLLETSAEVSLKSLDDICKRAIACLLSAQVGCDIENDNYEEAKEFFGSLLEKYGAADCLNAKEKRLFDGNYSMQDAVDVTWTYEAYWSLVWALGLIGDISDAGSICDCRKAITLVGDCASYEDFRKNCHMRDIEEILDMLDLYYRYDWACTDKRIRPDVPIGNLNPEVVTERRRGLEWLISEEDDWFEISMDT